MAHPYSGRRTLTFGPSQYHYITPVYLLHESCRMRWIEGIPERNAPENFELIRLQLALDPAEISEAHIPPTGM